MMTNDISVFLSKLMCYNRILIAGHVSPDADAIGSLLALGRFLSSKGKQVSLFVKDGCPDTCAFLEGSDSISGELDADALGCELLLLTDCSDVSRTGCEAALAGIKNKAVLDHHICHQEPECSFGLVDPDACSASILVYKLIKAANSQPDISTSEAILTGIAGDTGAFRFSNTTSEVLTVAADLTERGARLHAVIKEYFLSRPVRVVRLLGKVLSGLRFYCDDKVAVAVVPHEDFDGINKTDLEGINTEINSIRDLRLSILLREEEKGSFRCSLRSDGYVDCSRLAAVFGGGGHKNAAGCTLKRASSEDAVGDIMKEVANWKASFV